MPTPALELKGIDGHTLLKVLLGVQGPVSIKIVVNLPTEAGHPADSIRIYTDHNCIDRLRLLVASLGEKGDLELPLFDISLSEHTDPSVFSAEDVEEIKAPEIDRKKWEKMTVSEKQRLLLKAVRAQLLLNLEDFAARLEIPRSHLSNVMNGKRNLGWKPLNNLLERFPLSIGMRELVKETMLKEKNVR